jgi:hypothetical protein
MKSNVLRGMAVVGLLILTVSLGAAQDQDGVQFRGTIGDYTLANTPASVGGPWKVQGEWQMHVNWRTLKAGFTAELTMVRSDEGAMQHGGLDSAAARTAHTHHVKLAIGNVAAISNGFEVTGTATLTANGKTPPNPPFSSASVPVTIDITGGDLVHFSNMQLTLGGDAVNHFGYKPLQGAVKNFQ